MGNAGSKPVQGGTKEKTALGRGFTIDTPHGRDNSSDDLKDGTKNATLKVSTETVTG